MFEKRTNHPFEKREPRKLATSISLLMTDSELKFLRRYAKIEGITISAIVRRALFAELERKRAELKEENII